MIKKLIIKLFRLKDLSDLLVRSKEQQRKIDTKYWKGKLYEALEKQNNEHQLEIQEYTSQIILLEDRISEFKKMEKELDKKEYSLKIQARDTVLMATKINMKVEDFMLAVMKVVGEMKGIKEEAENHKWRIENRKKIS